MALNQGTLNTFTLNEEVIELYGVGSLVSVEQKVAIIGTGALVTVEQDVQLRLSATSNLEFVTVEQAVETTVAGTTLVTVQQRVNNSAVATHLSRTGWDAKLVVGGYPIAASQLTDKIQITHTEDTASLLTVVLRPGTGVQDITLYDGKSVTLDIITANGTYRAFTGVVDIPEIDLIEETITLRCSNNREELIKALSSQYVDGIGEFSSIIFGEPESQVEEVNERLSTIPFSLDFDSYNQPFLTSWDAKSTADYTFVDADVYRRAPRVIFSGRSRIINTVNINFQYRYDRWYHHSRDFRWRHPANSNSCLILVDAYTMAPRELIQQAANSLGWPLKDGITFLPNLASGWYSCSGSYVGFSNISYIPTTTNLVDETGAAVTDTNGNNVRTSTGRIAEDYTNVYTLGADWTSTTRWTQTITENFNLTVVAPQSVTQYGAITQDTVYSKSDDTDARAWEEYTAYEDSISSNDNYYVDKDTSRQDFNTACRVALNVAKTKILGTHRDTRVSVTTFVKPELQLYHTLYVNTDEVEAKGKIYDIKHILDISTGEGYSVTEVALYQSQGSTSETSLTAPAKPSDNVSYDTNTITLGNHFGKDPYTEAAKSWNGFVGNKIVNASNSVSYISAYPIQFIVDAPAVSGSLRNAKTLSGTASYNISIPDNTLVITFDGTP